MKKQDIKDGMILETRNGKRYLLINRILRCNDGYLSLDYYNHDLTHAFSSKNNVIKVYKDTCLHSLKDIFKDENLILIWERKETKLTEKEIELLRALSLLGYEWLARDEGGHYYAHYKEPEKLDYTWYSGRYWVPLNEYKDLFNFIQWEDEEPTNIDDLLKGI